MGSPSTPMRPLRALLLIAGFAAAAVLCVVIAWREPAPPPRRATDAGSPAEVDGARETEPARPGREAPGRPQVEEPPALTDEDLWAMVPDDAGLQEIRRWEFDMQGGASTPGTDPEGARREVGEPGWAERFEGELARGLEQSVLGPGARAERIDCEHGRCLVALRFDSMITGLGLVAAVREWLRGQVRCPAYTDGPVEEDSPSMSPDQQIWILCGEPPPG
jgi:hypothetical protein